MHNKLTSATDDEVHYDSSHQGKKMMFDKLNATFLKRKPVEKSNSMEEELFKDDDQNINLSVPEFGKEKFVTK